MSRFESSIPPEYFDGMYAADPDPWRFADSNYERDKYRATLAALPRDRYSSVLEVGCSIGVLTRQLSARSGSLLALDVAEGALEQARRRCGELTDVRFARCRVPGEWPDGTFDLILLSEVVYYLDRDDLRRLAERVRAASRPGGDVVLVHWLGETHYPLTGDEAADLFTAASADFARLLHQDRTEAYRLDVLRCGDERGAARPAAAWHA